MSAAPESILSSSEREFDELCALIARSDVLVLTGAGVSTASGIPDYRDERGAWKRKAPVEFRDFVQHETTRRRYWARSTLGWPQMRRATPNPAHHALRELERRSALRLLVTQNVDGLHQAAGHEAVVDLHGRIDRVICLSCDYATPREELQQELIARNPGWLAREAGIAPDGDADLELGACANFTVVPCPHCNGLLKPDVVFFGENVPRARVDRTYAELERSRALLIVGSSLMVYSGLRFARAAHKQGIPVILLNQGVTRADSIAHLKLSADAGTTLTRVVERLLSTASEQ